MFAAIGRQQRRVKIGRHDPRYRQQLGPQEIGVANRHKQIRGQIVHRPDEVRTVRTRWRKYRDVSPLRDFGGWGIRYGGDRICINASGSKGVEFTIRDAKRKYIIGSDDPEALVRAVQLALGIAPGKG